MLTESFKKKIFILIFSMVFVFSIFQFKSFFVEEKVVIKGFEKSDFLMLKTDNFLIEGVAKKSKKLYINQKEIFLNSKYEFSQKVFLSKYQNIFYIKSISKTGIIFEKELNIYFE
jgi:hypothetical protein